MMTKIRWWTVFAGTVATLILIGTAHAQTELERKSLRLLAQLALRAWEQVAFLLLPMGLERRAQCGEPVRLRGVLPLRLPKRFPHALVRSERPIVRNALASKNGKQHLAFEPQIAVGCT